MADAVLRATHAGQRAGGSVENLLSVLLNTFQRSFFLLDSSGRPMTGATCCQTLIEQLPVCCRVAGRPPRSNWTPAGS